MKTRAVLCLLIACVGVSAYAGSTGQTNLHMPQGNQAGTANGDYVSDTGGLNTVYRYWIEIPAGLSRITVEIFDADVGRGGAAESTAQRDRDRGGGFSSTATYELFKPGVAVAVATLGPCNSTTCNDNAWTTLFNSNAAADRAAVGHWELRVTMGGPAGNNDINAFGIRANDGNSGATGTEINVYADSMVSLGVNPNGSQSKTYTLFPYVTSGCTCSQNDFDRDTNSGDTGSVTYKSRMNLVSGATGTTQTFPSTTLSPDDTWNHDNLTSWVDDDEVDDYGIWQVQPTINTYGGGPSGNYETYYVGSYLTSGTPTGNPIVDGSGNPLAFRLYLPTDAGGVPVKPYMEQFLTVAKTLPGNNPPTIGSESRFTVTVRLVNPTPYAITFSATNLVRTEVPANAYGLVYGGNAGVSQGSIVSAPAVGSTGAITWNPNSGGSLAAGATAILFYDVRITSPSNGRKIITNTPASGNGTRATFVDETGNATQARATYTLGGLCELAVTVGGAVTEAVMSKFDLDVRGGGTHIEFTTASEAGTIGFNVYRADGTRVNDTLIPASLKASGGKYSLFDRNNADPSAMYIVEEVTSSGRRHSYGPFNRFEGFDREKARQEEERRPRAFATHAFADADLQSNAKSPAVAAMVGVKSTGIVRMSASDLASTLGVDVKDVAKALDKGRLLITDNGSPVSYTSDGTSLYFYAQKPNSIYSNERVYRIELDKDGAPMMNLNVVSANAAVSSFTATQDFETDVFHATVLPLDPESDYWFWAAFLSGDPDIGRQTFNLNVPSVASASGATLNVRLQGASKDALHRAQITFNGVPLGETTFTSFNAQNASFALPAALLRDGANEIVVEGVYQPGVFDIFYVDGFAVTYQKYARPDGGQLAMKGNGAVGAGPFSAAPMALDVTNPLRPQVVQGAAFNAGTASFVSPSQKDFYLAESFIAPSSVRPAYAATLKTRQRAQWLIIAPSSWHATADQLASIRQREGLTTYVADLEQIYDEFNGGNKNPHAIQDFLKYTRNNWSPAPSYVVLAGNGTVDYRGINGSPGAMPPIMLSTLDGIYASDTLYVDFNGDHLPDVSIGRIPVSSASDLASYIAKVNANQNISVKNSPMVFSADAADGTTSFTNASKRAETSLSALQITQAYIDEVGFDQARATLMNSWHSGSPLVSWVGHGGLDRISSFGVLTSYDAPTLTSTGRLPLMVAMTCTINRFENGFLDPLGVSLTRADNAGALAVWSASGLSMHHEASEIQQSFMRLASLTPSSRIGDLIVKSLAEHRSDTASVYLLLGDPALRVDLPSEVKNVGGSGTGNE
jgi:peptidase C25-like protein